METTLFTLANIKKDPWCEHESLGGKSLDNRGLSISNYNRKGEKK
jgi:hypothetical protein